MLLAEMARRGTTRAGCVRGAQQREDLVTVGGKQKIGNYFMLSEGEKKEKEEKKGRKIYLSYFIIMKR
jgi:hypothetical protein